MRTDGQTGLTKLIVAFRSFVNASKMSRAIILLPLHAFIARWHSRTASALTGVYASDSS